MELIRVFFTLCITVILLNHNLGNVEGRYHPHTKQKKLSSVPNAPADPSPEPENPAVPPPSDSPTVPSDPYPNDNQTSTSECVFDVRSFGAVGDGCADDTQAFRAAWKAACAVESGIVLAPENYSFIITSTIFSGPCKPGLVLQVRMLIIECPCGSHHVIISFLKRNYYIVQDHYMFIILIILL